MSAPRPKIVRETSIPDPVDYATAVAALRRYADVLAYPLLYNGVNDFTVGQMLGAVVDAGRADARRRLGKS